MRLVMPNGSGSCSVGGVEYAPDADGIVTVPDEAASELLAHGLTVAPAMEEAPASEAAPKKPAKKKE